MVFTCFFVSDIKMYAQNLVFDEVVLRVGDVYDYPMDLSIVHILGTSVLS